MVGVADLVAGRSGDQGASPLLGLATLCEHPRQVRSDNLSILGGEVPVNCSMEAVDELHPGLP